MNFLWNKFKYYLITGYAISTTQKQHIGFNGLWYFKSAHTTTSSIQHPTNYFKLYSSAIKFTPLYMLESPHTAILLNKSVCPSSRAFLTFQKNPIYFEILEGLKTRDTRHLNASYSTPL